MANLGWNSRKKPGGSLLHDPPGLNTAVKRESCYTFGLGSMPANSEISGTRCSHSIAMR